MPQPVTRIPLILLVCLSLLLPAIAPAQDAVEAAPANAAQQQDDTNTQQPDDTTTQQQDDTTTSNRRHNPQHQKPSPPCSPCSNCKPT